jgi:uncharacterized protein YodC (DUF2158 family)
MEQEKVRFKLQDHVRLRSGGPRMSVAGHRGGQGQREEFMCTWTDAEGQAWHEWFGEASLEACPPTGTLLHARCGSEVTVAELLHDVALYVWCDRCHDIVEAGELSEARRPDVPVDCTLLHLQVSHERVRLVQDEHGGTQALVPRAVQEECIEAWWQVVQHTGQMPTEPGALSAWLDERGPLLERATLLTRQVYRIREGAGG